MEWKTDFEEHITKTKISRLFNMGDSKQTERNRERTTKTDVSNEKIQL